MFVPEGAESFDWAAVVTREQEKVQKLAARVSRLGRFEAEEDCRRGVKNHIPPEKVRRGVMGGRGRSEEFAEAGRGEESRCTRSPDDLPGERLPTGRGETVPEKRECDDTPGRQPGGGRPRLQFIQESTSLEFHSLGVHPRWTPGLPKVNCKLTHQRRQNFFVSKFDKIWICFKQ